MNFFIFFITALLAGFADAFWRLNCGLSQTGRVDPIVTPGKVSSHVHKIAGAANIALSTTYEDLQTAECTTCEVQADKSSYWTPQLYYQHGNGSFEDVKNGGMTVYYLGRGDQASNIKPFPKGFRMLSGDPLARSYNTEAKTYKETRPVADRVSFACLDTAPIPESPGMNRTQCSNGLRAQIHFQSCWNGKDLYKEDNSHVAYMSRIDNGECPPTHPVQLIQLFYEVLYSMDSVKQDGGKFVFAHGDTTGFGFHGDFLNGWDADVQAAAIKECATGNPSGAVKNCAPLAKSQIEDFAKKCPASKPVVDEKVTGLLDKLPGCIRITSGPGKALLSDIVCSKGTTAPSVKVSAGSASTLVPRARPKTSRSATTTKATSTTSANASSTASRPIATIVSIMGSYVYNGCWTEGTGGFALTGKSVTFEEGMTVDRCVKACTVAGFGLAGLQYGQVCTCGAQLLNGARLVDDKQCGIPCDGDESQVCGGEGRLTVYLSG